jgi:hypothetical protein
MEETAGMVDAVSSACRRLWGFEGLRGGLRGCASVGRRRATGPGGGADGGMADIAAANRT